MDWLGPASCKEGRFDTFSDAAIRFYLIVINMLGLVLRQSMGMVANLLKLSELDRPVPDHSTLCRRQKSLQICISHRPNFNGLYLLMESIGVKNSLRG